LPCSVKAFYRWAVPGSAFPGPGFQQGLASADSSYARVALLRADLHPNTRKSRALWTPSLRRKEEFLFALCGTAKAVP